MPTAMFTNLPVPLTSFVGREREIREITQLLSTSRLVTLTGAGGVGKTRLAMEVARRGPAFYPDGVWIVELASLLDAAFVPHTVASALGLREQRGRSIIDTMIGYLENRQFLLLLDNCEHLVGACAGLGEHLLRSCRLLTVLATSREALNLAGEVAWLVPSLSVPSFELRVSPWERQAPAWPQDSSLPVPRFELRVASSESVRPGEPPELETRKSELLEYEAVRLFVERAEAVSPAFSVANEGEIGAVVRVCQRLDGIPRPGA